ncbi:MAG: hypothetical protein H7Z38_03690 [Rubrivivax sp.]|nr:hypothetical protein [Pyrinomonadaceae bacterium]
MPNNDFAHLPTHKKKLGRPPRLTESQLADIISSYSNSTAKALALKHKCSKGYILEIWSKNGMKGKSRRRYTVNLTYFETIDSPDKAYFLGFIAADGCIRRPLHGPLTLAIRISSKDEEVLVKFLKCLKSDMPVSRSRYKTPWKGVVKEASFVNVISEKICGDLAKHNIVERKTENYEPVFLPDSLMPHFTRGYFDGDGTVYKLGAKSGDYPAHYRFAICVNERAGRFFQSYLEDKGIRCSLVEDKGSSIFQLRIGDTLSKQKFVKLIYCDSQGLCLTRKKRLSDQFMVCCKRLKGEL